MHKISLTTKLFCTYTLVIGLLIASFASLFFKAYELSLISQGRNLAQQVILFRHWAAGYDGIWTKNKYTKKFDYLLSFTTDKGDTKDILGNTLETSQNTTFYLHNPALATRELSNLSQEKYGWTVNVVSDRSMSSKSMPNPFEAHAIAQMQQSSKDEYWEWEESNFIFSKALYITKSCLGCHGSEHEIPPATMKALKAKYNGNVSRATGYKVGEIRGIISIKILPPDIATFAVSIININAVGYFILALMILWFFTRQVIIRRLKSLSIIAYQAGTGEAESKYNYTLDGLKIDEVSDEITKLALALKRLPGMGRVFKKK